jgi:hypothetical protein
VSDLEKARTAPCPVCKMGAGQRCVDIANSGPDGGGPEVDGVHQPRIYRAYLVGEAIAENWAAELEAVIDQIRELHQPAGRLEGDGLPEGGWAWCKTCGGGGPNEYPTAWPCPTFLALPPKESR